VSQCEFMNYCDDFTPITLRSPSFKCSPVEPEWKGDVRVEHYAFQDSIMEKDSKNPAKRMSSYGLIRSLKNLRYFVSLRSE
jgi:hypothetical protein